MHMPVISPLLQGRFDYTEAGCPGKDSKNSTKNGISNLSVYFQCKEKYLIGDKQWLCPQCLDTTICQIILTFLTKKLIPPYSITISPQQTPHDPHIPFGSTQPSASQTHPLLF